MFRFSIRDVLWLTVVVALGLAWYAFAVQKQAQSNEKEREYRDQLFALKARIVAYQTAISSYHRLQDHQRSGLVEDVQKLEAQILNERTTNERAATEAFLNENVGK